MLYIYKCPITRHCKVHGKFPVIHISINERIRICFKCNISNELWIVQSAYAHQPSFPFAMFHLFSVNCILFFVSGQSGRLQANINSRIVNKCVMFDDGPDSRKNKTQNTNQQQKEQKRDKSHALFVFFSPHLGLANCVARNIVGFIYKDLIVVYSWMLSNGTILKYQSYWSQCVIIQIDSWACIAIASTLFTSNHRQ